MAKGPKFPIDLEITQVTCSARHHCKEIVQSAVLIWSVIKQLSGSDWDEPLIHPADLIFRLTERKKKENHRESGNYELGMILKMQITGEVRQVSLAAPEPWSINFRS